VGAHVCGSELCFFLVFSKFFEVKCRKIKIEKCQPEIKRKKYSQNGGYGKTGHDFFEVMF
jgi:hypothetical protein